MKCANICISDPLNIKDYNVQACDIKNKDNSSNDPVKMSRGSFVVFF